MGGFRGDGDLFCLSTDLVRIQMLLRVVLLKTDLYRANRIVDRNEAGRKDGRKGGRRSRPYLALFNLLSPCLILF